MAGWKPNGTYFDSKQKVTRSVRALAREFFVFCGVGASLANASGKQHKCHGLEDYSTMTRSPRDFHQVDDFACHQQKCVVQRRRQAICPTSGADFRLRRHAELRSARESGISC